MVISWNVEGVSIGLVHTHAYMAPSMSAWQIECIYGTCLKTWMHLVFFKKNN